MFVCCCCFFFYLEPFFIDDFAGVKRSHGVNLQNRFEGVEGQSGGRTQEVPCRVCTDTATITYKLSFSKDGQRGIYYYDVEQ